MVLDGITYVYDQTEEQPNDKSYIMQQLAEEKRTRYYSEDDKADNKQIVDAAVNDVAPERVLLGSKTSVNSQKGGAANGETTARSRHTSRVDDDIEKHGRSRHVSKVSFAGDAEKKPFDRQVRFVYSIIFIAVLWNYIIERKYFVMNLLVSRNKK